MCKQATLIEFSGLQRNKREHKVGRVHLGETLGEVQGEAEHRYTKNALCSCKNILKRDRYVDIHQVVPMMQ